MLRDSAEDLDLQFQNIVSIYSMKSESWWNYYRDKIDDVDINCIASFK